MKFLESEFDGILNLQYIKEFKIIRDEEDEGYFYISAVNDEGRIFTIIDNNHEFKDRRGNEIAPEEINAFRLLRIVGEIIGETETEFISSSDLFEKSYEKYIAWHSYEFRKCSGIEF